MAAFKKYKILPDLPEKLQPLLEIAYNLWMAWNPDAIKLFIRVDADLWEKSQHNPVRMLGEIHQAKLDELAADESFIMELERVQAQLRQYLHNLKSVNSMGQCHIAYFSAEFGLNDSLPMYSGGLGILSGDHVKAASDLNLKFCGVGILYQLGYSQQYLNPDGWQQDFYRTNDFHNMQVQEIKDENGRAMEIELEFPGRILKLKPWRIVVGRVEIFMLDANVDGNSDADRRLTAQLYGGDKEIRLQQEIILGIGGVRLLDRLQVCADVVHMNEGHSAFTPFERARLWMRARKLTFAEALEAARQSSVFTTHTNVPAGLDEFDPNLIRKYFAAYVQELGISIEEFLGFGRFRPENVHDNFSMTVAAIRNSVYVNGVSALHATVSRQMWRDLWRQIPAEHIPIGAITNGIHIPSWISFELNDLLERYLGVKWREKQDYRDSWEKVLNIPDPELWNVHEIRRRRLIAFTRQRLKQQMEKRGSSNLLLSEADEALNPQALTIGFARRFAAYKRADLLFSDPERLLRILNQPERPVQLIIAGKAHPQDQAGKEIIKNIIHFIQAHNLRKKIVFIEDYDINVARYLLQGADLWLNTPLRPQEACGTSGMKAACNGGLNLSVLDGWWDEAYAKEIGWAIGRREVYQNPADQNAVESRALYSILENDIVPLFYARGSDGLPREWIKVMKQSLIAIASIYNTNRMVKEYFYKFYRPAFDQFARLRAAAGDFVPPKGDFAALREFVGWQNAMRRNFAGIAVQRVTYDPRCTYTTGDKMPVEAELRLGTIRPEDIHVDAYFGNLIGEIELAGSEIENLSQVERIAEGIYRFSGKIPCDRTGNFGFQLRITPYHPLMAHPYDMNLVIWE